MDRLIVVVLAMLLSLSLISCSGNRKGHSTHKSNYANHRQKSELANKCFLKGKAHYLNFKLISAIEAFEEAVIHESSSTQKSRTYIYLGASYFYLHDFQAAKKNFSIAKRISLSVTPSSSNFPCEILNAFESSP